MNYAEVAHLHQYHAGTTEFAHPHHGRFPLPARTHQIRELVRIWYTDRNGQTREDLACGLVPPHPVAGGACWIVPTRPYDPQHPHPTTWVPLEAVSAWREAIR